MRRLCRSMLIAALLLLPTGLCLAEAQPQGTVRCTGKVVDPNGRPVAGAKVKVQGVRISTDTCSYELKRIQELATGEAGTKTPVEKASVSIQPADGRTGSNSQPGKDGVARFRLMPGQYRASVYGEGYQSSGPAKTITIEEGKTARVEYSLAIQPRIKGVVLDPQGNPVKGACVMICPMGGVRMLSGEGGTFQIAWSPQSYGRETPPTSLVCRYEAGNLACAQEITPQILSVELDLMPGLTFTGRVVDANDRGIGDAKVEVIIRLGNYGASIGTGDGPKTDSQGRFEIRAVPGDQQYSVQASADGYGVKSVQAAGDAAEDNRLDVGTFKLAVANMSAAGVVLDVNDRPVAGASVSVYGVDQPFRHMIADANGRFSVQKICAGRIQISANNNLGPPMADGDATAEAGDMDIRVIINERSSSGQRMQITSLKGKPLPDLKAPGVTSAGADGKPLLICMVDIEQRPSRKCLSDLAKKADVLAAKGVRVVVLQVSQTDLKEYDDWLKANQVGFPIQPVQGDFEAKKAAWGVKALPWLILTDKDRKVVAEGFGVSEIESVVGKVK